MRQGDSETRARKVWDALGCRVVDLHPSQWAPVGQKAVTGGGQWDACSVSQALTEDGLGLSPVPAPEGQAVGQQCTGSGQ